MQTVVRLREVLDLIVCPACQGRLTPAAATVDCCICGRRYPVVDDIPVLLIDRAQLQRD